VTAEWTRILVASGTATAGCVLLAAGLQGYLLAACTLWQRAVLVVSAVMLIDPNLWTDLLGAAMAGGIAAMQLVARRRIAEAVPRPGE
jgi:TRAP-type uncharacterized transport system fused permease subunit